MVFYRGPTLLFILLISLYQVILCSGAYLANFCCVFPHLIWNVSPLWYLPCGFTVAYMEGRSPNVGQSIIEKSKSSELTWLTTACCWVPHVSRPWHAHHALAPAWTSRPAVLRCCNDVALHTCPPLSVTSRNHHASLPSPRARRPPLADDQFARAFETTSLRIPSPK